ncbi:MAG: hypothetical protein UW60_C0028G0011 [Candidatus Woesebacteria bacterium GW2011_GWA2_44_33]|uniref:Uncharacterized protein n=3 Tax=Microgenomates group TaxID=1794810 RepID=A0A0G1R991_9BACT|nr:MAG: hypothetical protein UW61_C0044G0008 [Candidatus Curtissbacteria bacterium GW2011_GWC1_44_33]KKT66151.1 MAG: hypothetical protein UW60_C0028G0011 [Candidatus Woesebacteria bacterium GW2011_GWA2_44_33]KKU17490.1 MAG: hypothetical protein UX25_C0009G0006 [Candidatus Woesebacteria bacterium GW2011_GWC2_45_9]
MAEPLENQQRPETVLATNDRFSKIISDQDRSVLLSGPIPLVVDVLAKSVASFDDDEAKRSIKTRVVALNTRGSHLSNQVKEFISVVDGKQSGSLAPFHGGIDSDYLSIFCGVIEAVREINNPDLAKKLSLAIEENSREMSQNPNGAQGYQTLETIRANISSKQSL